MGVKEVHRRECKAEGAARLLTLGVGCREWDWTAPGSKTCWLAWVESFGWQFPMATVLFQMGENVGALR